MPLKIFMLQIHKIKHHFVLYTFMAILPFVVAMLTTSCGINKQLMVKKDPFFNTLPSPTKTAYKTLCKVLDENKKYQLESTCKKVHDVQKIQSFIQETYQIQKQYLTLINLLPETECKILKKQIQNSNLYDVKNIIQQPKYTTILKLWNSLGNNTKVKYIQLLKNQQEPQIVNTIKAQLFQSTPQKNTKEIITQLIQTPQSSQKFSNNHSFKSPKNFKPEKSDPQTTPSITQKIGNKNNANGTYEKEEEELYITPKETESSIPYQDDFSDDFIEIYDSQTDDWTEKLNLNKAQKKAFFDILMEFSQKDQSSLKELINQTEQENIENFCIVYFQQGNFTKEEKSELLATLIYLYKGWPKIALKLCNCPWGLSNMEQLLIFRRTRPKQLKLLLRLNDLISQLFDY